MAICESAKFTHSVSGHFTLETQDLSDLDLDKAADDVDLFDNEAALSEAVTQAFEVRVIEKVNMNISCKIIL